MSRREFVAAAAGAGLACTMGGRVSMARSKSTMKTGHFYDPLSLDHPLVGADYPQRLTWIQSRLEESGLLRQLTPVAKESTQVVRTYAGKVHPPQTLQLLDSCNRTAPSAYAAVGGILGAIKAVADGEVRNAFCAIRPPGHHAYDNPNNDGSCQGQGFCFLNNAGIAARYAQEVHGYRNILIVDWDYHHGNATQDEFYEDPTVFFFSTHNFNAYPGTGDPALIGRGAGLGYNLNVHLPCGTTNDMIVAAFQDHLFPAMEQVKFTPDLILISAGFDSKRNDALGCFDVTPHGFSRLTKLMCDYAGTVCGGRVVSLLEGGYQDRSGSLSWNGLACCVESHVRTLLTGQIQTDDGCLTTAVKQPRTGNIPDPSQTGVLSLPSGTTQVRVSTLTGRVLKRTRTNPGQSELDIRRWGLSAGQYAFQYLGARGEVLRDEVAWLR